MDSNLFEYLIILFFIFSAIQSILSKKKKDRQKLEERQKQKEQSSDAGQTVRQSPRGTQQKESPKDILEEMFGLKFPEDKEPKTKTTSKRTMGGFDPPDNDETSWNPEEEYEDSLGIETTRYAEKEEKSSYEYQEKMAALERKAEKSKRMIDRLPAKMEVVEVGGPTVEQKLLAGRIKNTLRDPETLREYILVSELLNKPRALRR